MNKLFTFLLCFCASFSFSQEIVMPSIYELPKNEKLSLDAFTVFETNKYLDFKNKDILVEKINDSVFKKTDLNNYFRYKKNWEEIEDETASTYKNENPKYSYEFVGNTMIEKYDVYGSYNVNREMKTIYDLKGFVLLKEEKVFVGDNFQETRSTINSYDSKNRAIKIIDRVEKNNKKENSETVINASYTKNKITITSKNGTIVCELLIDKNSVGFVSKLNPKQTVDSFRYALIAKNLKAAKEYCTEQMSKKLEQEKSKYNQITGIKSLGGQGGFGEIVKITENWEINYSSGEIKESKAIFSLIQQKNGWKIDAFLIQE